MVLNNIPSEILAPYRVLVEIKQGVSAFVFRITILLAPVRKHSRLRGCGQSIGKNICLAALVPLGCAAEPENQILLVSQPTGCFSWQRCAKTSF